MLSKLKQTLNKRFIVIFLVAIVIALGVADVCLYNSHSKTTITDDNVMYHDSEDQQVVTPPKDQSDVTVDDPYMLAEMKPGETYYEYDIEYTNGKSESYIATGYGQIKLQVIDQVSVLTFNDDDDDSTKTNIIATNVNSFNITKTVNK
jgi:hypothetical protein